MSGIFHLSSLHWEDETCKKCDVVGTFRGWAFYYTLRCLRQGRWEMVPSSPAAPAELRAILERAVAAAAAQQEDV